MIIHSKLEFSTYIRKAQYRNLHMFFRSTRIEVLFEEKRNGETTRLVSNYGTVPVVPVVQFNTGMKRTKTGKLYKIILNYILTKLLPSYLISFPTLLTLEFCLALEIVY